MCIIKSDIENVLIIADQDNTEIYLNDDGTGAVYTTLNAGEYVNIKNEFIKAYMYMNSIWCFQTFHAD